MAAMTGQLKLFVGCCVCGTIVFCTTFAIMFSRANKPQPPPGFGSELLGKAFPPAKFTNLWGASLDDTRLRQGKVVLVFVVPDCEACEYESQFLRTLMNKRSDVRFYGVIPMGQKQATLTAAVGHYPFELYYDDGQMYVNASKTIRVPMKIFMEDGIVRKAWEGASLDDRDKSSFSDWLAEVK